MCYHKRLLYTSCHHIAWGRQVMPCNLQRAHEDGYFALGCETMFAHPLHSICIQSSCKGCVVRKKRTDGVARRAREVIGEVRDRVERMQSRSLAGVKTDEGSGSQKSDREAPMDKNDEEGSRAVEYEEDENEEFEMLSVVTEEEHA